MSGIFSSGWDTSQEASGAASFNEDIGGWDTSKVTSMARMFYGEGPSIRTSAAGTPPR